MAKHEEFLKQVKALAEVHGYIYACDVLKLLAIIEKLKGELEFTEHLLSNGDGQLMALWKEDTDKELDEIVGQG